MKFDVGTVAASGAQVHNLGTFTGATLVDAAIAASNAAGADGWAAGDGDNDVTRFTYNGAQYVIVAGDDAHDDFTAGLDYVVRVNSVTGTLDGSDFLLV
jgi:hypothetical protein